MSRILSRISMLTGQISSHALQLVQAQISSELMRSNTLSSAMSMSPATPTGGETGGEPVAAITSPTFNTISRGSSGLPVACAGHTDVQRPHTVHASVSKSCFQVKSSIFTAPNDSRSVSMRFGIGFIAPLGRSRSFRYMFMGDVNMWRSFVTGRIARNARNATTCTAHNQRCADERPLLERRRADQRDAERFGDEPAHADEEECAEDDRVLGLGLDADA